MTALTHCVDERAVNGVYSVVIDAKCVCCGHSYLVTVPEKEWLAYTQDGKLIQEAIPSLSDPDRELLISNTCGKCFDSLFIGNGE